MSQTNNCVIFDNERSMVYKYISISELARTNGIDRGIEPQKKSLIFFFWHQVIFGFLKPQYYVETKKSGEQLIFFC